MHFCETTCIPEKLFSIGTVLAILIAEQKQIEIRRLSKNEVPILIDELLKPVRFRFLKKGDNYDNYQI